MDPRSVYLVGIAGGTASGKTTACEEILAQLGPDTVVCLSQDSFYKNKPPNIPASKYNFDHPNAFDWDRLCETLIRLKNGQSTEIPVYNYVTHSRMAEGKRIKATTCVLFEGILSLYDKHIRQILDMKVFIDTPADIRLTRRIRRDMVERGRDLESILNQYEATVSPAHDQFVEPTKKYADLIVPCQRRNGVGVSAVISQIKAYIYRNPGNPRHPRHPRNPPTNHGRKERSCQEVYDNSAPQETHKAQRYHDGGYYFGVSSHDVTRPTLSHKNQSPNPKLQTVYPAPNSLPNHHYTEPTADCPSYF